MLAFIWYCDSLRFSFLTGSIQALSFFSLNEISQVVNKSKYENKGAQVGVRWQREQCWAMGEGSSAGQWGRGAVLGGEEAATCGSTKSDIGKHQGT